MTPSLTFSFQDGQLGFGGRSRRFNARPVARLGAAVDIRAGGSHTCALEVGERFSGMTSPKKEIFNILGIIGDFPFLEIWELFSWSDGIILWIISQSHEIVHSEKGAFLPPS